MRRNIEWNWKDLHDIPKVRALAFKEAESIMFRYLGENAKTNPAQIESGTDRYHNRRDARLFVQRLSLFGNRAAKGTVRRSRLAWAPTYPLII